MKSISKLNDTELISATDQLVKQERELLTKILLHLKEIEKRRLFSELGFRSLYEYAVKRLSYSEDQAYRRIEAMRALKELPELEAKIDSGTLTLSHITMARKLFKSESKLGKKPISKIDQLKVIEKLEGKSAREAQKLVLSLSSDPVNFEGERAKQVSPSQVELKLIVDEELLKQIEKLKGLLAHSNPGISTADLIKKLCSLGVEKWDKGSANSATFRKRCVTKGTKRLAQQVSGKNNRTPLPANIQRTVWQNAQSKCEHCDSTYALEIEHIQPVALGGANDPKNLKLLCRNCNQRAAIKQFGPQQMDFYFRKQILQQRLSLR